VRERVSDEAFRAFFAFERRGRTVILGDKFFLKRGGNVKTLVLIGMMALITGCSSVELVRAPQRGNVDYAPVNDNERAGVVKYSLEGSGSSVEDRREEAYEKMHDTCEGDYRITSQEVRKDGKLVRTDAGRGMVGPADDQELFIQFKCVK